MRGDSGVSKWEEEPSGFPTFVFTLPLAVQHCCSTIQQVTNTNTNTSTETNARENTKTNTKTLKYSHLPLFSS